MGVGSHLQGINALSIEVQGEADEVTVLCHHVWKKKNNDDYRELLETCQCHAHVTGGKPGHSRGTSYLRALSKAELEPDVSRTRPP